MISKKMRNISMVCLSLVLALSLAFGLSSFSVKKASADTATLSIADFIIVNQKGESAQDWTVNSTHTSKIGTSKQSYNGITKLEWSFSALGSSNAGKFHYRVYVNDTSVFSYDYDSSNKIVANTTYSATVNNLSGNVKIEILKRDNTSPVLGDVIVTYSSDSSGDVTDPEDPETPDPEDPTPGEDETNNTTVSTICSNVTKTVTGNTTVWTYTSACSSTHNIAQETTDLGIVYYGSSGSNIKYHKDGYLSVKSNSVVYIPVPANHKGTITMTTTSTSDSRFFALVIDDEMSETKRLYSKPSSDGKIASDGKTGPQSFAFTSSDLTEYNGNYYLVLKDNNQEMKVGTFTLTTEKEEQEPTLEGYTYIGKVGDVDAFAKAEFLGLGFKKSAESGGVRFGFGLKVVNVNEEDITTLTANEISAKFNRDVDGVEKTFDYTQDVEYKTGVGTSSGEFNGYVFNLVITGLTADNAINYNKIAFIVNLNATINNVAINSNETSAVTIKSIATEAYEDSKFGAVGSVEAIAQAKMYLGASFEG